MCFFLIDPQEAEARRQEQRARYAAAGLMAVDSADDDVRLQRAVEESAREAERKREEKRRMEERWGSALQKDVQM